MLVRLTANGYMSNPDAPATSIVQSIADKHALARHFDVAGATDVLWAINHPNLYMLLAGEREWSPERYELWLGDLLCTQILRARGPTPDTPEH
jgi:hypothetical protein